MGKNDRDAMEDALKSLKYNKEVFEDSMAELSSLLMYRYESLKDAGFTEGQAFQIILERGLE